MANYEIDSFVRKFKVLCQAGRSASLTLSSDAGKASLNLSVDLGVLPDEGLHHPHHPRNHSRNAPARQCRRQARDRSEGGKAYSTLTYEDYSDDEDDEIC